MKSIVALLSVATYLSPMRPNADIPHALNGRVKDLATEWDCSLQEAYERVIERGADELEQEIEASA
jgi:hypothetical protein